MIALIHLIPHLEAVLPPGGFHELPQAGGTRRGVGLGVEVALDGHQVLQVLGDAVLLQDRDDLREDAPGALEHQRGVGVAVGEVDQLPVHPLIQVGTVEADRLAGELDVFGDFGRLEVDVFRDIDILGAHLGRQAEAAGKQEEG